MAQEIEIEFKNMLTKQEYDKLRKSLQLDYAIPIEQTNHYFETNDFKLKNAKVALRIREVNNLWQLTLKEPYQDGLLETHDTLSEQEAREWLKGNILPKPHVAKQLNKLGIDFAHLHYGGALKTYRLETNYKETTVVLDYSIYNGISDYELELEANTKDHGEKIFFEVLANHSIKYSKAPNKIERFYTSLNY
ncbi:CYTH domain-containing protein [Aquibacillus salsiterrae]|uniref:CYTH domain-containing protein n=1 Tax=Aquibacillus salsiterrae TaxID=2950439 RepID=A0A9X3WF87_9BACI|nr:CYTH domain-containing protein [Aquibacillus salsiterrae]MDC3417195.1 CYTH domain-containing protein [Aquibacillus salsiterrae]